MNKSTKRLLLVLATGAFFYTLCSLLMYLGLSVGEMLSGKGVSLSVDFHNIVDLGLKLFAPVVALFLIVFVARLSVVEPDDEEECDDV